MGNRNSIIKPKVITNAMQLTKILKDYSNVVSYRLEKNELYVVLKIKPTQSSKEYKVRLKYEIGKKPIIKVDNIKKDVKLPHTYSNNELCLYYTKNKEWTKYDYIGNKIIPWISEWLYFYEVWLVTDKWLGGGIHPE